MNEDFVTVKLVSHPKCFQKHIFVYRLAVI